MIFTILFVLRVGSQYKVFNSFSTRWRVLTWYRISLWNVTSGNKLWSFIYWKKTDVIVKMSNNLFQLLTALSDYAELLSEVEIWKLWKLLLLYKIIPMMCIQKNHLLNKLQVTLRYFCTNKLYVNYHFLIFYYKSTLKKVERYYRSSFKQVWCIYQLNNHRGNEFSRFRKLIVLLQQMFSLKLGRNVKV